MANHHVTDQYQASANELPTTATSSSPPNRPSNGSTKRLRAYLVDRLGSVEVACRFGYTHGSFRVLCHQFRHDPDFRARFFSPIPQGSASAPVRDPLRDLVVAMRKRNLSVYDIQRELAGTGQSVSINTLTLLLREEGFARLPRRLDDERPETLRPEPAAIADVRTLSLAPRSFRTRAGGLFLFVPVMRDIQLAEGRTPGGPARLGHDPRRASRPQSAGPQTSRHASQESCHGPGLR